jgi:hypothetical protein
MMTNAFLYVDEILANDIINQHRRLFRVEECFKEELKDCKINVLLAFSEI